MSGTLMSDELRKTLGLVDSGELAGSEEVDETPREPAKMEWEEVESAVPDLKQTDAKTDYILARKVTYTLIDKLGDALAGALRVAQETEHPRAYECVNQLAMTVRGLTQDLVTFQKTFKEVIKDRPEVAPAPTAEGGTGGKGFTTTDLLNLMEKLDKGEISIEDLKGE